MPFGASSIEGFRRNFASAVMSVFLFANTFPINIKTDDIMFLCQSNRERQANISEANDGDGAHIRLTIIFSET